MERKLLTLAEAKIDGAADGPGRLTGYASVWDHVDSYGDTIVRGAYKDTIPSFLKDGFIPWGHDWYGFPIATPDVAKEDDTGLWIEADFHSDPESQRARALVSERLERGKSMGLSIGYEATGYDFQEIDDRQVRRLLAIKLFEVSLVMVPADPNARVASVKGLKRHLSREQLDRIIGVILEALTADEAPDEEDAAAAAGGDGKAADPPSSDDADGASIALDLVGAKLISDVDAFVSRLRSAGPDDVLAAREATTSLMRKFGTYRQELDESLKRTDVIEMTHPQELLREFRQIQAVLGATDIDSSREAASRRAG